MKTADTVTANNENYKQVLLRNSFYKDKAHTVLITLVISAIANLLMAIAIVFFIFNPPPAEFIVADANGSLIKAEALSEPQKTTSMMRAFASNAVTTINSLDWVNYRTQLTAAANYFTNRGWSDYRSKLETSNVLKFLNDNKLTMAATPTQVPQVLYQGVLNGNYTWKIEVPILITYSGGTVSRTDSKRVTMVIQRVPFSESPNGVGIVQYLVQ